MGHITTIQSTLLYNDSHQQPTSASGWQVVGVWRPDSKEWTHPTQTCPHPMHTVLQWLVVAGGASPRAPAELLNTDSKQWYTYLLQHHFTAKG